MPSLTISNGTLAGSSALTVAGPLTWSGGAMSGTGRTVAAGGLTLNGTFKTLNRTLTNAGAATWSDTGDIYMGTGGVLNNQAGATFTAQNNQNVSWIDGTPHFDNAGTFVKDVGGGSTQFSIAFNNSGTVVSRTGTLSFAGGYQQSAGTTRLEGGALASYPALNLQGGKLEGSGLITGDVQNGGEVSPGSSPGLLTITGAYTQLPAGTFNVEIGGRAEQTQFDKLAISGFATLDGALKVSLINSFRPSSGDAFQVMTFSGSSSDFSSTSGLDLGNGLILMKSVGSDAVTLLAAPPPSVTPTPTATTPAFTPTPTPTPTATSVVTPSGCSGDCRGDGLVTVDELLTMINIALGSVPMSACGAGDINGDQRITVDEILAGVNNALNGCAPQHAEAVAGAVTTTVVGATGLSSLLTGIVSGFASATGASVQSAGVSASSGTGTVAGNCPSGTATRTCTGFGTVTMTIRLSACTVQIAQGSLELNGTVTLEGAGFCPDTIIPPVNLTANVQATITDGSGLTTAIHRVNVTGLGSPHSGGPCTIDGATLTLNGTLRTDIPGAGTVTTTFHQTIVTLRATTFSGCVPTVYSETLDGFASLSDSLGGAFDVTFAQLTTTTDGQRDPTEITIDGGISSMCIGRPVALSTISSLKMMLGEVCPTDGQIRVASLGGRSDIFYRSDGTVDIHAGNADRSFASCRDAAFFVCSM